MDVCVGLLVFCGALFSVVKVNISSEEKEALFAIKLRGPSISVCCAKSISNIESNDRSFSHAIATVFLETRHRNEVRRYEVDHRDVKHMSLEKIVTR